jgi:hypothetical protein
VQLFHPCCRSFHLDQLSFSVRFWRFQHGRAWLGAVNVPVSMLRHLLNLPSRPASVKECDSRFRRFARATLASFFGIC